MELDKLRPEVAAAIRTMSGEAGGNRDDAYDVIEAELLRLAEVELSRRAERIEALAEANRQRERAERAESALAELRAKVESAPVGVYAATAADHGVVHTHRWIAADLIGKRVRLLLDDGESA